MTDGTIDLLNAFGSAAAGALLGSLSAFCLGVRQQRRDQKEREHAAVLRTHYALGSQWNIVEGIRRGFLEPLREDPNRHLKLPVFYSYGRHACVPFEDLAFIAASDEPNLLQEIHIAEQRSETVIECLRARNQRLEEFYRSPNVEVISFDEATGASRLNAEKREVFFMKKATDVLYDTVAEALPKLIGEMQAIEAFTKRHFKGMKAIKFVAK